MNFNKNSYKKTSEEDFFLPNIFPEKIIQNILAYSMETSEDVKKSQSYFGEELLQPFERVIELSEFFKKNLIDPFCEAYPEMQEHLLNYEKIKKLTLFENHQRWFEKIFASIEYESEADKIDFLKYALLNISSPFFYKNKNLKEAYDEIFCLFPTVPRYLFVTGRNCLSIPKNFLTDRSFIQVYILKEVLPELIRAEIRRCGPKITSDEISLSFLEIDDLLLDENEKEASSFCDKPSRKRYCRGGSWIFLSLIIIAAAVIGLEKFRDESGVILASILLCTGGGVGIMYGIYRCSGWGEIDEGKFSNTSSTFFTRQPSFIPLIEEEKKISENERPLPV